jgi:hypothetical protein
MVKSGGSNSLILLAQPGGRLVSPRSLPILLSSLTGLPPVAGRLYFLLGVQGDCKKLLEILQKKTGQKCSVGQE